MSSSVSILEPLGKAASDDPSLVILTTWMNAQPKHIAKYTAGYQVLYPGARIAVVRTSAVQATVHTTASNIARLEPVLTLLQSLPPSSQVLLHSFSNGGGMTAALLARTYTLQSTRPLPLRALILDSSPGIATYAATIRAFSVGLPNSFLVKAVLSVIYAVYIAAYWVTGDGDLVERVRRDLLRREWWGEGRRLYLYGEGDEMVGWRDVEAHMGESREQGWKVRGEKWVGTGHCNHIGDGERYWGAIKKIWDDVE